MCSCWCCGSVAAVSKGRLPSYYDDSALVIFQRAVLNTFEPLCMQQYMPVLFFINLSTKIKKNELVQFANPPTLIWSAVQHSPLDFDLVLTKDNVSEQNDSTSQSLSKLTSVWNYSQFLHDLRDSTFIIHVTRWHFAPTSDCNRLLTEDGKTSYVYASPAYQNNRDCTVLAKATLPNHVVQVEFFKFEMENVTKCQFDSLSIYADETGR